MREDFDKELTIELEKKSLDLREEFQLQLVAERTKIRMEFDQEFSKQITDKVSVSAVFLKFFYSKFAKYKLFFIFALSWRRPIQNGVRTRHAFAKRPLRAFVRRLRLRKRSGISNSRPTIGLNSTHFRRYAVFIYRTT